jgi:Caspase domain
MPRIFALLVGINKYTAVPELHGCVDDINAVEALLTTRVEPAMLDMKVLRDADATRANIIDGFRTHLGRAGDGDITAFYFCGHGSEERCPAEWLVHEPSGMNQTIVPVDARTGDVFDIADKELSALIHDVSAKGAQVVTLFDSCHSGGVTRNVEDNSAARGGASRMTAASTARARTLADYLELARTLYDPARVATDGPPEPRHIAISACQHDQLAKEFPIAPPRRGAFTQAFEEAVHSLGPTATYIDLVTAIRTKVRDRADDQMPNLTVVGGAAATSRFLDGHAGRRDLTVGADAQGVWWLSAGVVDGVPDPAAGHTANVALHNRDAFAADSATAPRIATATVDLAREDRARLRITSNPAALNSATRYVGVITQLSAPAMHVLVSGAATDDITRVREHLVPLGVQWSVVQSAVQGIPCITVLVAPDALTCADAAGAALPNLRFARTDDGIAGLAVACSHMAQWFSTRDRAPLGSSLNGRIAIDVVPVAAGEVSVPSDRPTMAATNGTLALQYAGDQGPRVQLRLRNTGADRLYVALLDLSDSFGCAVLFADWIPANSTAFVKGGKPLRMTIPAWRDPSVTLTTDWLKVFAARADFTPDTLTLPSLLAPQGAAGTRDLVEEEDTSFWGTTMVKIETRR